MFRRHVQQQLSAYVHGELSPSEMQRVAAHLQQCARCQAEYEEIRFGAQLASQLRHETAPDDLWAGLESLLEQAPNEHQPLHADKRPGAWLPVFASPFRLALTAVALALFVAAGFWWRSRNAQPLPQAADNPLANANTSAWTVTRLAGQPQIGAQPLAATGKLPLGEWLVTDQQSRAQISVGQIGEVKVEPNSRIQLLRAQGDEHRLAMTRGKMEALIWAPPRQFFVNTPSATAVDLGCAYTLEVNDDGVGQLRVTLGWVAFEWQGRESFVPAEAMCITRPGLGPGTPYFADAPEKLQQSLALFDTALPTDLGGLTQRESSLTTALTAARKRDALTLWHLLTRTSDAERGRVYDRLAELLPPPQSVTRAGVLAGDRAMIDAWWEKLDLGSSEWWRLWKGAPPQTK